MYIRTVSDAFEYFAIWLDKYWLAVVVIFLAWFGVGVWASTENTEGFDPNKLVLDDSFFKTYNIMNKKYGMSTYDAVAPVAIYLPDVDLTVKENQLKIMELTESATLLENSNGPKSEWIVPFLTYLGTQSDICSTAPGTACEYTSTGVDLTDNQIKSKIVSFLAVDEYKVSTTLGANNDAKGLTRIKKRSGQPTSLFPLTTPSKLPAPGFSTIKSTASPNKSTQ